MALAEQVRPLSISPSLRTPILRHAAANITIGGETFAVTQAEAVPPRAVIR